MEYVFPTAKNGRDIRLKLRFRGDRGIRSEVHPLKKQAKNWRLVGDKIDDACFGKVNPGDLFLMTIDAIGAEPKCTFTIVKPKSRLARFVLSRSTTNNLGRTRRGMIAIHSSESEELEIRLSEFDEELFPLKRSIGKKTLRRNRKPPIDEAISEKDLLQPPNAARTIEFVASMGYDLNVAVADLIDNSIAAGAKNVEITFPNPNTHGRMLAISDDGSGMTPRQLLNALRFGTERDYQEDDLGKFGIGLKAASLSQARAVFVASRPAGGRVEILGWDKSHVKKTGEWRLSRPVLDDVRGSLLQDPLVDRHGTVVLWDDMIPLRNRPEGRRKSKGEDISVHGRELRNLSRHLGKVFHRFIEGVARGHPCLQITLNGTPVKPWDPLAKWHAQTQILNMTSISIPGASDREHLVEVHPGIVPALTELKNNAEADEIGYWGNWLESQGFYFYRNDRIIQDGGWCNLWTYDPHFQLLRVAVDIDSALDQSFGINVSKMSVQPPALFMREIGSHLIGLRKDARHRYDNAGKKSRARKKNAKSNSKPGRVSPKPATKPASRKNGRLGIGGTSETHEMPFSGLNSVPLNGKGWRCRIDAIGSEVVELDSSIAEAKALYDGVAYDRVAAKAIARLLIAIDDDDTRKVVLAAWRANSGKD